MRSGALGGPWARNCPRPGPSLATARSRRFREAAGSSRPTIQASRTRAPGSSRSPCGARSSGRPSASGIGYSPGMTVLFLCRQNAGRSQMARAFFERIAPGHKALSGGSSPAARVHPEVLDVMREVGIDLAGRNPQKVDADMLASADLVISMGCDDPAVCEYPGRKVEDWGIEDPAGKPVAEVRRIRDLLRSRVRELA